MSKFIRNLNNLLTELSSVPECLEQAAKAKKSELKSLLKSSGQGSANKVTNHEACIAEQADKQGFKLTPTNNIPSEDGLYYWYQLGGSQRSGDFLLFEVLNKVKTAEVILDAKHSNGATIYLNDGTFEIGTLYVISYTKTLDKIKGQKTKPRKNVCMIGLGENIMSQKDRTALEKRRDVLKQLNKQAKEELDNLRLYARSANQYKCSFTPEFVESNFKMTQSWISSSFEQTTQEPHSQSVLIDHQ